MKYLPLDQAIFLMPRWLGYALWGSAAMLGAAIAVVPAHALLIILMVFLVASGTVAGIVWITPGVPIWMRLLIAVMIGHWVLGYSFANIMLKLGGLPLPITEMVLVIGLAATVWHVALTAKQKVKLPWMLWIITTWVVFNLGIHLPSGWLKAGVMAARDALPTLEILFLLPAFVFATLVLRTPSRAVLFERLFITVGILVSIYNLSYPWQEWLLEISPRVPGFSNSVSILGHFGSQSVGYFYVFATLLWIWQQPKAVVGWRLVFAGLCIFSGMVSYALAQGRVSYLFFVLGIVVLICTGRHWRSIGIIVTVGVVAMTSLALIEVSGTAVKGRISNLSATGIVDHLISLTGESRTADFSGSANGVHQRKKWREDSLEFWEESPQTMVFGIGFGDALTDHVTVGSSGEIILVREPHNSFLTTMTRSGLVGLAVILVLHSIIILVTLFGYWNFRQTDKTRAAVFLGGLLWQIFALLSAWGQPFFENPYCAVPTYFIYGLLLALWSQSAEHCRSKSSLGIHHKSSFVVESR